MGRTLMNSFENVASQMATILSRPYMVNAMVAQVVAILAVQDRDPLFLYKFNLMVSDDMVSLNIPILANQL